MALEWIYLLKVNAGIALFYAFYKLFCQRDTFFQWRRIVLLSFLGISFLYPLLDIQDWVMEQPAIYELADYYTVLMNTEEVTAAPVAYEAPQRPDLLTIFTYLYYIGAIVMSVRFIIQLASICHIRWKGQTVYLNGQRIISLPSEANPFSFFGWIFLYLPQLEEESQEEILMHEQTHARQWHSVDVIVSEIANIVCWFNPFSWLLKGEIRLNLEYLADNQVAQTLNDSKQYQYHLLGLAHTNSKTGLYNNFNVSQIKHRIIMMNKKRTHTVGRIKYALFAPLAAALLMVSNISCTSTENKKDSTEAAESRAVEGEEFQIVEQMPEFPGGMGECMKWLGQNIKYPAEAIEKEIQGRVILQIIVEKDGTITNAVVAKGVHPLLDNEALRVINQSPKWEPGKQNGEAVRVKYTLPVLFKLNDKASENATKEEQNNPDENGVYQVCEEMPEFPGGMQECMKWLGKNIKYPTEAIEKGIQGRVILQMVVEKDGSITNAKVVRSVDPLLDKEALRVINLSPKWTPAKHKGEAVKVRYTLPVMFRLQ